MIKFNNDRKIILLRQLALIYDSDILSTEGIELLKKSKDNATLSQFYESLEDNLISGLPLSVSIENSSDFFKPYELKLIELGETSGNISTVLNDMADGLEREEVLKEKLNSAFRYPSILASLTLFILLIIIAVIVPVYHNLVLSSGAKVSGFMAGLNSFGVFLRDNYAYIIAVVIFLILFDRIFAKTNYGSKFKEKHSLKSRLTKNIKILASATVFTKNLALLLDSGIDYLSAFEILEKAESDDYVKKEITEALEIIRESSDFAKAMRSFSLFPDVLYEMLEVAVKTGHVVPTLKKLEKSLSNTLDKKMERLVSLIEPTITIIISLIVAVILISGIMPVFRILSNII